MKSFTRYALIIEILVFFFKVQLEEEKNENNN